MNKPLKTNTGAKRFSSTHNSTKPHSTKQQLQLPLRSPQPLYIPHTRYSYQLIHYLRLYFCFAFLFPSLSSVSKKCFSRKFWHRVQYCYLIATPHIVLWTNKIVIRAFLRMALFYPDPPPPARNSKIISRSLICSTQHCK